MGLSKRLEAVDHALADRNRKESQVVTRDTRSWSPTAPVPEDPGRCRWCRGRLVVLEDTERSAYCQNLCSQTHTFERRCLECSRLFETGSLNGGLCWTCDERTRAESHERGAHGSTRSFRRYDRTYRA